VQTEAAGGVAPDVLMMSVAFICQFARDDLVLNLMPYINRDGMDLSAYWQAGLDEWRYRKGDRGAGNGDLFALTVDFSSSAFIFNKTLFDAAGVDYPDESWTWDTLVAVGTELTQDTTGDGIADQWGYVPYRWADMGLDMYVRQNGGAMLNPDYTECLLDRPRALEGGQWMYDLYHTSKIAPVPEAEMLDPWNTGKAAMAQKATWNFGGYAKIEDFEWDVAPTPAGPSGSNAVVGQGDAMSIFSESQYPDQAWELLKHLTGPGERGPEMIVQTGMQPPTRDLTYSDTYLAQPGFPEHMNIVAEELETSIPCFVCLNWMELADELNGHAGAAWLGEATIEEAFLAAKEAADEVLDRIEV
jgi:multiple sugar transport system substrate-binding protein